MGNKVNPKKLAKVKLGEPLEKKLQLGFMRFDVNGDGSITAQEIEQRFKNSPQEGKTVKELFA